MSNFDMQNFTNTSPDSVDEFLSHNVSSNQKEILEFFKKFNTNAHDLYRAGIYILKKDEMKSAKASLVYHCFFELSNVFAEIGGTHDNNSEVLPKNKHKKKDKPKNIFTAIKGIHPEASEDRVKYINELFKSGIIDICKWKKHCHKLKNDDLVNDVQRFEKTLGLVIPWYNEIKKKLDKILQKANTSPYTKPTDNELKDTVDLKQRVFNEYFFFELKNPEWIKFLEEKKLLYFWKDFANCYAERYLLEIADKKPDEVYDVIKLFWDDLRQDEMLGRLLYRTIFEIGIKMSKTKKECLLSVAKDFLSYLKATKSSLMHVISSKFIIDLLKTLASIGYEEKALEIFSECLKLDINAIPQHPDINEIPYAQGYDFVIVTRFGKDNHSSPYCYEELLREGNEVFQQKPKELFKIYCGVIGNSLKSLSNKHKEKFLDTIEEPLRVAIESNFQESYAPNKFLSIIISVLLGIAKKLMTTDDDFVLSEFRKREKKNKIFLYLIFNLLGLSLKIQKLVRKDGDWALCDYSNDNFCNNGGLPLKPLNEYEQEEYEHIKRFSLPLSEFGVPSPLEDHEMQEMSVEEIIKYSENIKYALDNYGFSQSLEHDVKQNTRKYLDGLLKFKGVSKAIYIVDLFSGLRGSEKTESDWKNIAELGLWTLEQKTLLPNKIIFGNNWTGVYITLLRLFEEDLFKSERLQTYDVVEKSIYDIIKKLVFDSKGSLLSNELKSNCYGLNYLNTASNNLYGVAVESLIKYAILQHKNKKDITDITLVLDELLNKSKYEETWTLLGCHLLNLYLLFQDWTKQNINKILPANDNTKFKAAWITYIIANYANSTLFDLCKDKFEYALKNKLYIADKRYMEALGRHISLHYAIGEQINLDDDMMKLIFDIPELLQSMINFIGKSLKGINLSEENIDRFKSLWDWIIFNLSKLNAANQSKYHYALKEFQLWYGYGYKSFPDREWLLDQMYNLVVEYKIDMGISFFYNTEEALQEDLPMHTMKVFEIVREHSKSMAEKDNMYMHYMPTASIEIIKKVLGYIKSNTFEKDNSLKHEADAFINKRYGNKLFDEFKEYLNYPLTNS
ncbi:MAG: hypothetical protein LBB37_01025 [Endomicrobium sp.]|nr:hypothetical protein [Endomicrobium sp.]